MENSKFRIDEPVTSFDGFLKRELEVRKLPSLLTMESGFSVQSKEDWEKLREEIKSLLCREFAGFPCTFPLETEGAVVKTDENAFGGKAVTKTVDVRVKSPFSYVSFPCTVTIPKGMEQAFLHPCQCGWAGRGNY